MAGSTSLEPHRRVGVIGAVRSALAGRRRGAWILLAAIPFAGLGIFLVQAVLLGFDREGPVFRAIVAVIGIAFVGVAVGLVRHSRLARTAAIALAGVGALGCSCVLLLLLLFSGESRDVAYMPVDTVMLALVVQLVVIELLAAAWVDPGVDAESTNARPDGPVWHDPTGS